jgi:hypothetical protein
MPGTKSNPSRLTGKDLPNGRWEALKGISIFVEIFGDVSGFLDFAE